VEAEHVKRRTGPVSATRERPGVPGVRGRVDASPGQAVLADSDGLLPGGVRSGSMPQYLDLEVVLDHVQPPVWRRFLIDERATFLDLHQATRRLLDGPDLPTRGLWRTARLRGRRRGRCRR
jgi:hypothetical protein